MVTINKNSVRTRSTGCPTQYYSPTQDGRVVYIRYRWGILEVGIGADERDAAQQTITDEPLFRERIGDEYDGDISLRDVVKHTSSVIEWIDVRNSDAMKAELDLLRKALLDIRELASDPPISSDVLADNILAVIAGVIADDGKDV